MNSADAETAKTALRNSDNLQPSSITLDERIRALLLPFQCSFCEETFRGHFKLLRHIKQYHDTKIQIECGICHTVYFKPVLHAVHFFNKHLDGASPDLIEKLKTELGFYEKWKRKSEKGKHTRQTDTLKKSKVPRKENDTPRPKQRRPPPKSKDPKPKPKTPTKNDKSFDCSCGEKLKSLEHLDAHKSSHKIRIDPTIKCHLCAAAFDCVDDWRRHNCEKDSSSNIVQGLQAGPEPVEVSSRAPSPECADLSVASPASPPRNCDSPVASPGSLQNFDSPVASPGSPPEKFDSPVGSPALPPPTECDLTSPVPSSPPRTRDDFTALLRTFQKVIDDLPPPTRQLLDLVPPTESSPLHDLVHIDDDDDSEIDSPAEPLPSSPQYSQDLTGTNDAQVPPKPSTINAEENQRVGDLPGDQLQESQKEIPLIDLASSPSSPEHDDSQPAEATKSVAKSKRGGKKRNRERRKPIHHPPEDLEVFTHLRIFNFQPSYNCDQCAARFQFKLHLVEHKHKFCQGNSASSEYNGCRMCGEEFSSKEELEAHFTSLHKASKPGSWACDLCDHVYDWERALKFHKDSTHKNREKPMRICRLCSKPCARIEDIVKHYRAEHPKNCYSLCACCGQQFKDRYDKKQHQKREHPGYSGNEERVVCEICGKEMTRHALKVHMLRVHAEKNFLCTNCGASFGSLALLQKHEFIHLPAQERPFACKFCSYRAAQILSVEQHMARRHLAHDGFVEYQVDDKEKPFVCDQCGKSYTSEIALEEHKLFHGERKYKCRTCNEYMFTRYHLVAHQQEFHVVRKNVFPEPRPCPNPNCSKTFTSRAAYFTHRRICGCDSTSRSANKCDECGKVYGSKADLTYHIRSVHLKTFAYHCEVCGKGSNSKSNLKAHMKLHGGGHECDVCKLKFPTFPILSKHSLDEHGTKPIRIGTKRQGVLKSIVESLKESSEVPQEESVNDAV